MDRFDLPSFLVGKAAGSGGGGGSGGGVLVVGMDLDTMTLDKTWQEINDADFSVMVIIQEGDKKFYTVSEVDEQGFSVSFSNSTTDILFSAASASDYPVFSAPT